MSIYIAGIGTVCGLGAGIDRLEKGLASGITPELSTSTISFLSEKKEVPYYRAPVLEIEKFVNPRALRRIDTFSQMSLLASYLAIEDAKISLPDMNRVGIVFGSTHGPISTTFDFIDTLIDNGDGGASPTYFANSVHNAPAAQVSLSLKIKGPCSTLTNFQSTVAAVLFQARQWLDEGRADFILAGAGEDYCPAEGYAIYKASGERIPGKIEPFALDACSFIPGQGWVTFLLSAKKTCGNYGKISSIGLGKAMDSIAPERLEKAAAVILSAKGNRSENENYELLMKERSARYSAYSHLYGSMSTGSAFDLAVAALSIKNKTIYSCGMKDNGVNEMNTKGSPIICIESTEGRLFNIYELEE